MPWAVEKTKQTKYSKNQGFNTANRDNKKQIIKI